MCSIEDSINYYILMGYKISSFQIHPGMLLDNCRYYPTYKKITTEFIENKGFFGKLKDFIFGKQKVVKEVYSSNTIQKIDGTIKESPSELYRPGKYCSIIYYNNKIRFSTVEVKLGKTFKYDEYNETSYLDIFKLPSLSLSLKKEKEYENLDIDMMYPLIVEKSFFFKEEKEMLDFIEFLLEKKLINLENTYCIDSKSKSKKKQLVNTVKDYFNYLNKIYDK